MENNQTEPDVTEKIRHTYPVVSDKVIILRHPKESYLTYKKKEKTFVNNSALKLVCSCDGTKSIFEIITSVYGNDNVKEKEVQERLMTFFTEFQNKGYLFFSQTRKKHPSALNIRGSFEYIFPTHMNVELTQMCNLKCKHCYMEADSEKKPGFIDTEKLLSLLQALYERGLLLVELTGGEPTLHPDFFQILDFCTQRFGIVAILTNGTTMTEEMAKKLSMYKDKIGVSLSLDGSTAEIHDTFRGVPGSFVKTIHAAELLKKYKVRTAIGMDVYPGNRSDIEQTLLLAKQLGAFEFSWTHTLPVGRGKNTQWTPSQEEYQAQAKYEIELKKKYKEFLPQVSLAKISKDMADRGGNCGAGHQSFALNPKGEVRTCLLVGEKYLPLGNLFQQTPEDVFGGPLVRFLSRLQAPMQDSQACKTCQNKWYCHSCWGRAMMKVVSEQIPCLWLEQSGLKQFL